MPEGTSTRAIESYRAVRPVGPIGWFIIETLAGITDIEEMLCTGMQETLEGIEKTVLTGAQS